MWDHLTHPIRIPGSLLSQVYSEAQHAYPDECCGWLIGPISKHCCTGVHVASNCESNIFRLGDVRKVGSQKFCFSHPDQVELAKSLDTDLPAKIIYHSHCDAPITFSKRDQESAIAPDFSTPMYPVQQLVVGVQNRMIVGAALYAFSEKDQGFVTIAHTLLMDTM